MLRVLESLRSGRAASTAAFIYGPRGNGKTVLLQWLERQAAGADGGTPVQQVRFSSRSLGKPERIMAVINRARSLWSTVLARLRIAVKTELPGISAEISTARAASAAAALGNWLAESKAALLVTMDEAHVANSAALGAFLDQVQIAGRARPIALVLAGTPGLETTLGAAGASFWSHGVTLPIGLLSDEEAHAVLAQPFRDAGLEAEDAAAAALATTADNYPFFLQLYGKTAWDIMATTGERVLREGHVQPTIEATAEDCRLYYMTRYDEFESRGRVPLAEDMARTFRTTGGQLQDRGSRHRSGPT